MAVSPTTVGRWERDRFARFPPPLRVGRTVRYDSGEVLAWVTARREAVRVTELEPAPGLGIVEPELLPEFLRPRVAGRRRAA